MGNIVPINVQQVQDDVWASAEKMLKGDFRLAGLPLEVLTRVMERMRSISDRWIDRQDGIWPTDPAESKPVANLLMATLCEVAAMEGELYRLRHETGAK